MSRWMLMIGLVGCFALGSAFGMSEKQKKNTDESVDKGLENVREEVQKIDNSKGMKNLRKSSRDLEKKIGNAVKGFNQPTDEDEE